VIYKSSLTASGLVCNFTDRELACRRIVQ